MEIEEVKSVLSGLIGQKDFEIIDGPVPGVLGCFVFDTPMPWIIDMSNFAIPFLIGIKTEKGNLAILYFMTIENYEVRT